MASPEQLRVALNAAVPPTLFLIFVNSILGFKVFGVFKIVGAVVPHRVRELLRRLYMAYNATATAAVLVFLGWNCDSDGPSCLPAQTIVAFFLLACQWLDRACLVFLQVPDAEVGFGTRTARGLAIGGYLMAVVEQNDVAAWFLALCLLNRSSGSTKRPKLRAYIDRVGRAAVGVGAARRFYADPHRLSALCVAVTLHSR